MSPPKSGTTLIHGDKGVFGADSAEVAPSISVTTTFRNEEPHAGTLPLADLDFRNPALHVYSRYTNGVSTRAEHILSAVNDGYALTYASGLAASFAALIHYQPKRIAITGGYHGCHAAIKIYQRTKGSVEVEVIGLDDAYMPGDLCWLETPVNPTGESRDIRYYADKIHGVGGNLLVDATFGPPPLQYPFKFGADCVMHSATKYFGGHSDLLSGILVVKTRQEWDQIHNDRTFLGSMMGSLESWLLLRSLKTFHLRIPRQSESALILAQWLNQAATAPPGASFDGIPSGVIVKVYHSSLQGTDTRGFEPSRQMEGGWSPTFSILLSQPSYASILPHRVKYFIPATSLGGVESLIEYRRHTDPSAHPGLVRISIGVEEVEDLKHDLREALQNIVSAPPKL